MIYSPYVDLTWYIRADIPLRLQEFPRASPSQTPLGEWVYLTVYPSSRANTDTLSNLFSQLYSVMFSLMFSLIYSLLLSLLFSLLFSILN